MVTPIALTKEKKSVFFYCQRLLLTQVRIIKSSRNNAAKSGFLLYVCDREGWSLLMPVSVVTTSSELRVLTSRLGFWHLNLYDMDSPDITTCLKPKYCASLIPADWPSFHLFSFLGAPSQILNNVLSSLKYPSSSPLLLRGLTMNNLRSEEAHTLMTAQDITYACVHSQLRLCIVPLYQANVRRKNK